ncbi:zf-HC2 domain-containing protein [Bryobacter aggregatus]|uniref:zf-HC2 domain-containing protein n=1 Tax=Bryobacter aggregatus TaxID=360054 RepID=UPI0004E144D2|nr:zf-HC2 domain-containing protein [Bryobacter aggregatus]
MNCGWCKEHVELYVFGELDFDQEEKFEQHIQACAECAALVAEHQTILQLMHQAETEMPPSLLAECRSGLHSRLNAQQAVQRSWQGRIRELFPDWSRLLRPVIGFAMLAISFYAGKQFEERKSVSAAGVQTARIRTIQGTGNGMVQIVLEEPRQRMIVGGLNEEGIEQALMVAARQSPDPVMRIESLDLLRNRCSRDDVRQTMLQTLEKDDSPSVRLRALEGLRPCATEGNVRQALARVLLSDVNPNIRVQAIDLLVDRPPAEIIGTLQEVIRHDENDYVRARCLRVLSEMRASPGVF